MLQLNQAEHGILNKYNKYVVKIIAIGGFYGFLCNVS